MWRDALLGLSACDCAWGVRRKEEGGGREEGGGGGCLRAEKENRGRDGVGGAESEAIKRLPAASRP